MGNKHSLWEETEVLGENPRLSIERWPVAWRRKRGPLGIFGVGAPVHCCHCLTEILYLYWIFTECSGKFRVCKVGYRRASFL
jgi:hypothetical protein